MEQLSKLSIDIQLTLGMMFVQTLCMVLQTGLIVVTIWIASRWRKQFVGGKKFELAMELDAATWELYQSFIRAIHAVRANSEDSQDRLIDASDQIVKLSRLMPQAHVMFGRFFLEEYKVIADFHAELDRLHKKQNKGNNLTTEEIKLLDLHIENKEIDPNNSLKIALSPIFEFCQSFAKTYK